MGIAPQMRAIAVWCGTVFQRVNKTVQNLIVTSPVPEILGVPTGGNFGIGKQGTVPKKCVRIRGPLLVDLFAASSPHACVTKTTGIGV